MVGAVAMASVYQTQEWGRVGVLGRNVHSAQEWGGGSEHQGQKCDPWERGPFLAVLSKDRCKGFLKEAAVKGMEGFGRDGEVTGLGVEKLDSRL